MISSGLFLWIKVAIEVFFSISYKVDMLAANLLSLPIFS